MASVSELPPRLDLDRSWTAADLVDRFGPIPLYRIRSQPPPGTATEEDWIEVYDRSESLFELVDGVLVEKTMSWYESYLALFMGRLLGNFVETQDLGVVLGSDGPVRLMPQLVRMPDAAFISWQRLPGGDLPEPSDVRWLDLAPDLAVEVISKGNTRKEMDRKLAEYFAAGVRQVWYVYPKTHEVHVYDHLGDPRVLTEQETLDGGEVLPGFRLPLAHLFAKRERR